MVYQRIIYMYMTLLYLLRKIKYNIIWAYSTLLLKICN